MAAIEQPPVVADAGPIIHLDEMGCLDLLGDFGTVLVPREVWDEVARHRSQLAATGVPGGSVVDCADGPTPRLLALANSLGLDAGETAALALMEARRARLFLCDDAAARLAAESLGFDVHGTIGIIVRATRARSRTPDEVLAILRRIPDLSTLHISGRLLAAVIADVEQDTPPAA